MALKLFTNGGSDLNTKLIGAKDMRQLTQDVEVADIGCGFGGLLVALAPKLPNTLLLGELPGLSGSITR
jgi:tRNA (guanine-N7-)-methyltransferase